MDQGELIMPWTDWKFPSANQQLSANSSQWSNPDNAHADDTNYAIDTVLFGQTQELRRWTGFGFTTDDIPSGAAILGIQVQVHAVASDSNTTHNVNIFDATNGTSTEEKRKPIPESFGDEYFGGAGAKWGESSFSDNDIRASTFGVEYRCGNGSGADRTFQLDFIRVRVYYRTASEGSAGSVPVIESSQASNSSGSATSLVATAPAGISAGDTLLIIAGSDDESSGEQRFSIADMDWIPIDQQGDTDTDCKIAAWILPNAVGDETDVTINHNSSDDLFCWYIRLSGVDVSDPIDSILFSNTGSSSTTHNILGITTERNNCQLIYGLSFNGADGIPFGQPAGWTEQDEETSSPGAAGVWGNKSKGSAGTEPTAAVTSNVADTSVQFMLALKPTQTFGPDIQHMNNVPGANIDFLSGVLGTNISGISGILV